MACGQSTKRVWFRGEGGLRILAPQWPEGPRHSYIPAKWSPSIPLPVTGPPGCLQEATAAWAGSSLSQSGWHSYSSHTLAAIGLKTSGSVLVVSGVSSDHGRARWQGDRSSGEPGLQKVASVMKGTAVMAAC